MKKSTKIWLWVALVICIATTILNATEGRWPSVAMAVCSMIGLCILLFAQKKLGFYLMCGFNTLSFLYSAVGSLSGENAVVGVVMSFVGAALIPVITGLFLRSQWKELK